MSDLASIRAANLPPANEQYMNIVAALAHFNASMHALRDLLTFIGPQEAVLDNTEQSQTELFTSTIEGVSAERQPRAAVAIMELLFELLTPAMNPEVSATSRASVRC